MKNWQTRAGKGGVADFRKCFDFYFKWLTDKVMSCFIISDAAPSDRTRSINWDYFKLNLILDGQVCITDFNEKLYACIGNRGGTPNEYYVPTQFIIANPILGSKQVNIDVDGVVFYNTKIDQFWLTGSSEIFATGLYDLIEQTATLLADNIISINCVQVNARVNTFFDADSEAQAIAGEAILKKMYAGVPYMVLRGDLIEKIRVNPVNTSATGQNITELVELHNYIIANFFQSIGIKSNNVMKRERLIRDEIESQDDFLQVSILEMLAAWKEGLDKVNQMYGTEFTVKLNPVLLNELMQQLPGKKTAEPEAAEPEAAEPEAAEPEAAEPEAAEPEAAEPEAAEPEAAEPEAAEPEAAEPEAAEPEGAEPEEAEPEEVIETIEQQEKVVEAVVDLINDNQDQEEGEDVEQESGTEAEQPDTG